MCTVYKVFMKCIVKAHIAHSPSHKKTVKSSCGHYWVNLASADQLWDTAPGSRELLSLCCSGGRSSVSCSAPTIEPNVPKLLAQFSTCAQTHSVTSDPFSLGRTSGWETGVILWTVMLDWKMWCRCCSNVFSV